ncbi:MAG: DUF5103 domain-containing protein, partial [Bacteroidetes bacterium]|nr:DUF5103 domain-containing protein [Bacteroidota bacterium]
MKFVLIYILLFAYYDVFSQKKILFENYTYEPQVQSVQLTTSDGSPIPVINLNTAEKLILNFDEVKASNDYYQYSYQMCDAEWKPVDFEVNMYCKGMPFGNIDDYKFSQGTYVKYVHYQKVFPTEEIQIQWAGNYILKVFRNFDENDIVITRRFMVLNRQVNTVASIKPATDIKYRFSKQELDLEVEYSSNIMPKPMQDIKVVYQQNNRWDNVITGIKPQYVVNNKLNYNYEDVNLFNGVNEFRMFDTRSLRKFSQFVSAKSLDKMWHCILFPEENKVVKQYLFWSDFNGRKAIGNKDQGNDPNVDADYCDMYFSFPMTSKLEKPIYIYGELTDWQIYPQYELKWNEELYKYELHADFKQGVYNYL